MASACSREWHRSHPESPLVALGAAFKGNSIADDGSYLDFC